MKTIILNDDLSNVKEFENAMSDELLTLWEQFHEEFANGFDYNDLKRWEEEFKHHGVTFEWGLDADPYNFQINI